MKKGFKQLYGNTIYGYLTDVRMEKAKSLLIEGNLSITEIADLIGYKNPQHFTVAFKKKFQQLPKDIRKK